MTAKLTSFSGLRVIILCIVLELKYCETNNVTCQNGATCVSLPEEDGNYRCLCADGYIGRNCEVDKKKVIFIASNQLITFL